VVPGVQEYLSIAVGVPTSVKMMSAWQQTAGAEGVAYTVCTLCECDRDSHVQCIKQTHETG
jgi:hypothetical protein